VVNAVSGIRVRTDPAHGGRWTSLHAHGREWLWARDDPRRDGVGPGDPFADAGGLEECVPTVRGTPDHGDAWSRRWTADTAADRGTQTGAAHGDHGDARTDGDGEGERLGTFAVECPDFRLTRTLRTSGTRLTADYVLTAAPGYRFLWAGHALLDISPHGRLDLAEGAPARLYADGGADWSAFTWPSAGGVAFDRLGPDDGSALGAIVGTAHAAVHDGSHRLSFALHADGQPLSVALWRNLRGFPEEAPYRSIGVEPMLGRVFDLAAAGEEDTACVPASGEVRWRLTVTADSS
jgi:hypothetical protein